MFDKLRSRKTKQLKATTDATASTEPTVLATTRVSMDAARRVKLIAQVNGWTESEVLRRLIEDGCKQYKTLAEVLAEEALRVRDQF